MKKIILFTLLLLSSAAYIHAQDAAPATNKKAKKNKSRENIPCPKAYIGLNTGFNNPNGLFGLSFEIPVIHDFSLSAGVGAGLWGTMAYGEGRYYLGPCQRGWALGAGFAHSTGRVNFKPQKDLNTVAGAEPVSLNLLPQTNFYVSIYRAWNLGKKRNKIFAELGWSVPFNNKDFKQISGDHITSDEADKIRNWAPGGLIIGGGIYFGIH